MGHEFVPYRPIDGTVSVTTERGSVVSISSTEKPTKTGGKTAQHEAAHVVVAGRIKTATIKKNGSALGSTTPEIMTAPAAAAGAADGDEEGSFHDRVVTEVFLRASWSAAKSTAGVILATRSIEQEEVAGALEENGTIGQNIVDFAFERARRRRNGIANVKVEVTDRQGQKTTVHTETRNGNVTVPIDLVEGKEVSFNEKAA